MSSRCSSNVSTLLPFLYPSLFRISSRCIRVKLTIPQTRCSSTNTVNDLPASRLNPAPDDYSSPTFIDKAPLTLYAGKGGNGCVSFLREAYMDDGPANGGDGGAGGNIYIQAAHGETSLHKLARKRFLRAGRGRHGQGSAQSGSRGEDVVITVPVGTIVRELEREDKAAEEAAQIRAWRLVQRQKEKEQNRAQDQRAIARKASVQQGIAVDSSAEDDVESATQLAGEEDDAELDDPQRAKWLLYPGMSKSDVRNFAFPRLPRRVQLLQQPASPIYLDLSRPTPTPILLATGGIGGLGNPHFTSRTYPRPVFATRGEEAITMKIELELKLLADVGLVGLPNAGKSTLLRALTNSRTRVGSWAFTTLQPNIGTVVLDKYTGRPDVKTYRRYPAQLGMVEQVEAEPRTRFSMADIPGLIQGAHLDRGLGIAFLRHVERAGVLAFVIDLSAGNAVKALEALWKEVGLYARMREEEEGDREVDSRVDWDMSSPDQGPINLMNDSIGMPPAAEPTPTVQIAGKPWFVVATKADLPETQDNFRELKAHLDTISRGETPHPSGVEHGWTKKVAAIPVSAISGQGVDRIVHWTVGLLDE